MDRYVVIGNPVAHSLSPAIHARFAALMGERIEYTALRAPLGGFATAARRFFDEGGSGANVTLPFKIEALRFAAVASDAARLAGAANFLARRGAQIHADNTDGAGLVADLTRNLGIEPAGKRILIVGAGGAARGVIAPLLALAPRELAIANRTVDRARELVERFSHLGALEAMALGAQASAPFDVVINATSSSTHGETLALPAHAIDARTLAYDMAYGKSARPFLEGCAALGAATSDGLGMLVEQAAESYARWRGSRPPTAPVLAELRSAGT